MEKKRILYIIGITAFCIVVFSSCSARKNTAPSRFFHALNARYNTYFNGKTSFDEALKSQNDGYSENYTEQIYMFPINGMFPDEKSSMGGPFNRAIEKGNKAIKLHSIKDKPPRKAGWQNDPKQVKLQATEEFNPFIKHCWMLIAESHFYNGDFLTAAVTYSYITRHFATDPELVAEARIRQARCYTQMDWFYETNNLIKKLNESGIPPKQQKNYDRMAAEYLVKSEQSEKAIPYLLSAIQTEKNKRQRSRMRYLLGQLYMTNGQQEAAYQTFGKVAASNPPYEIEFASRIRQTEVFPGDNYEKTLKMLRRMSKSDKNTDFLDQVYYAMGNVYMTLPDTVKAIESYALGIEKSTQNGMDKAICQIRLGDIYFTQKQYVNAQPCFSGALSGLQKEYKDYDRVSRLSETLDALVVHYEAVHLQDSLQTLASMTEDERLVVIDKIIEQLIEDEKKAEEEAKKEAYLAQQESSGQGFNQRSSMPAPVMPVAPGGSSFYFYNPQIVAQGKTQFENRWGKRTLEDHWRRRNKQVALLLTEQDNAVDDAAQDEITSDQDEQSTTTQKDSIAQDPKTREYYLQQIPLTEEDIEASDAIILEGLFQMGMIYKDKLEDIELSLQAFEELDSRFPDNKYCLEYYYHIYLMALRYKETELAEKYKNLLLTEFPTEDYTIAISDPEYEYNMRMMDSVQDSIYEWSYYRYLAEDTAAVRSSYVDFSSKYPLANLMPKFMFLNALTYVQAGDAEGFKEALTLLTEKYPDADVTELANEMLRGLLRGRQLMQGSFSPMTWNYRFGVGEDGQMVVDSSLIFQPEQETPHRLLLIYSTGSVDRNQLLYAVAAFNFANFRVKGFDLSYEESGALTVLTINGFNNLTEILDYYRIIYGENGYATAFDAIVSFFPFSDENYNILMRGKTLEEYMHFFIENYAEIAPFLVNRWRTRVDADLQAMEEEATGSEEFIPAVDKGHTEVSRTDDLPVVDDARSEEPKEIVRMPEPDTVKVITQETLTTEEAAIETPAQTILDDYDDDERPAAKRDNIFNKLFKRVKESKEFKSIEESFNTLKELAAEETLQPDSVEVDKPLERVGGELTFEQIQEIRTREAEEKAILDAEIALSKEEAKKTADELKKQQAIERDQQRKAKEKAAKERKKQQDKERKATQKKRDKERKEAQKKKDNDRKAAQKEKEKVAAQKRKANQK